MADTKNTQPAPVVLPDRESILKELDGIPSSEATYWYERIVVEFITSTYGLEVGRAFEISEELGFEQSWSIILNFGKGFNELHEKSKTEGLTEEEQCYFHEHYLMGACAALTLFEESRCAEKNGRLNASWHLLNKAHQIAIMLMSLKSIMGIKSEEGRARANKRHTENHAMRDQVRDYYLKNKFRFKSLDEAAEKIAGKIVPLGFRAVRKHLTGLR